MQIGKISEFNVAADNCRLYVERLEQYFLVNSIEAELKVPTLITVMGAEGYELLVNLCTPDKPTDKSFKELTDVMEKHLQPRPSILAERYKFHHRKQHNDEKIADYVAELKKMTKTCEFGQWLNESLRDQLVCGLTSETIRQRLFAEDKLDFQRACSLALSLEAAEKDAASVEATGGQKRETVECQVITRAGAMQPHGRGTWRGASAAGAAAAYTAERRTDSRRRRAEASTAGGTGRGSRECRVCGAAHEAATCKFRLYVCRVCNREGHLQRVCPRYNGASWARTAPHNYVEEEDELSTCSSEEVHVFNQLSLEQCPPIMIPVKIDNIVVKMECDTGCAISCISLKIYNKCFSDRKLNDCKLTLRYYTGETIRPVGVIKPLVKHKDKELYLDLYVIDKGKTMLLGRQWLAELDIQIPNVSHDVNNIVPNKTGFNCKEFSSRYCEVFADGLGRFTGGRVSIHLREGARAVWIRARPVAYVHREAVERELERLQRDGVPTPLRNRLDLLRGDRAVLDKVSRAQDKQIEYAGGRDRQFRSGEEVWARSYRGQNKWEKGTVMSEAGSRRVLVRENSGRQVTKHVDQLRRRKSCMSYVPVPGEVEVVPSVREEHAPGTPARSSPAQCSGARTPPGDGPGARDDVFSTPVGAPHRSPRDSPPRASPSPPSSTSPVNYPKRIRKPVVRFNIT